MSQVERKPHKHAELIKAWADGARVQFLNYEGSWVDVSCPNWGEAFQYRIKPEPVRTVGYRRYLWTSGGVVRIAYTQEDSSASPAKIQAHPTFKEWIDHTWQYHEVLL